MSHHKFFRRNSQRLADSTASAVGKGLHIDARRMIVNGHLNSAPSNELRNAFARRDHGVTEIGVFGRNPDGELFEGVGIERT